MNDPTTSGASLLENGGGMLTPRLTTPEQDKGERETGVVGSRARLQYLDGLLTPPASTETARHQQQCRSEDPSLVYIPVEVDIEKLHDWSSREQRNGDSGAKVTVNGEEIALFKYGERLIATQAKCPHAGGPLYEGEIEELPDRSLCVKCPWHKWTFCVSGRNITRRKLFGGEERVGGQGQCVSPALARGRKVQIFHTVVNKKRNTIKIGFENLNRKTLFDEAF